MSSGGTGYSTYYRLKYIYKFRWYKLKYFGVHVVQLVLKLRKENSWYMLIVN